MTRRLHWGVGISLGVALGVLMLLAGGIFVSATPTPRCPGCAVLTHATASCGEAVVGGYVCP